MKPTQAVCVIVVSVREQIPGANDRHPYWDIDDEVYQDESPCKDLDVSRPRKEGLGVEGAAVAGTATRGMQEDRDGGDVQYAQNEEGVGGVEVDISIHPVRGRPGSAVISNAWGSHTGIQD